MKNVLVISLYFEKSYWNQYLVRKLKEKQQKQKTC